MINVNGGIETKKYIKHANFVAFEGMGHNLPRELNPKFLELISDITKKGELYEEKNAQNQMANSLKSNIDNVSSNIVTKPRQSS